MSKAIERVQVGRSAEALSLRGLQEVGLQHFGDLGYRAEVARRMAQSTGTQHLVLFDDVALAVPEAQRDKLHGLPGYERALLPGLWQAAGFAEGATVLVAAPPSPVEMRYVRELRLELAGALGREEIPYRILFERQGQMVDLMQVEAEAYQQMCAEYATTMADPHAAAKYKPLYHLELLQRHQDEILGEGKTLVVPFQVTDSHQQSLANLVEQQRVVLPDTPVLDKAETNLFLRSNGFTDLPQLYAISGDGTVIEDYTTLEEKKAAGPTPKTAESAHAFAQGVLRAVDLLAQEGQRAYVKLDSTGVSGLGNLDPELYPAIYDTSLPATERLAALTEVVQSMQSDHLPPFAVVEEFVTPARIEGVPLDYTMCGQMVNGEFLPTSANPFRTTHGVYDAEWVAASAEMLGESSESWTALYRTFAEMGRLLAQNGYRNGILAGDVFVTEDGRRLVHDFNFRRGGRSTPESLMAFRQEGWFEAQIEVDLDNLGIASLLKETGINLDASQLVSIYNQTAEHLYDSGIYPFSTAFGYFAKGSGEHGHDNLKFKLMVPTDGLGEVERSEHLNAVRAQVLRSVLEVTGLAEKIIPVEGTGMQLFVPDGVWPPYKTAIRMVNELLPARQEDVVGKTVLDMGTGSGVLSVAAGLMGADRVVATDLNPGAIAAVKINWVLNGLDPDKLEVHYSDGFAQVPDSVQVDTIIANPPVQTIVMTNGDRVYRQKNAYAWNEAEANGRAVLDTILIDGPRHLKPGGKIVTLTSTRHGQNATEQVLNDLIAQGEVSSWRVVLTEEQELAPFYYQYIDYWRGLQDQDGDPRIWQKDGRWHHKFIVLEVEK